MNKITILIFLLISSMINAQNCTNVEELLRKRHTISGMTYGHPYTIFDRHNGFSLEQTIQNIRVNIKLEQFKTKGNKPTFDAYKVIYDSANTNDIPSDNGMGNYTEVSKLAEWAKDNAFVFLVGMNANGQLLDEIDTTGATRNAFRDRAKDYGFSHLTGIIDADKPGWGWWLLFPPFGYMAANFVEEQKYLTNLKFHSRSLMLWLQTYDLLKGAYELKAELRDKGRNPWGFGDADKNGLDCSQRNKLRKLTRDLYYYSKGIDGIVEHATGWKKNHGIAAASALLMSAQVLNDAGTETNYFTGLLGWLWGDGYVTPFPKYSPINWNELGQKGLEENLFVGNHRWPIDDVPVALSKTWESYSPYSEGTHYTHYGLLDCGIPAMVAQKNIYQHLNKKHLTLGIAYIENLNHV